MPQIPENDIVSSIKSYSLVVIFNEILVGLPAPKPEVVKSFFSFKSDSIGAQGPEGFGIFGNFPNPIPRVAYGGNKFAIACETLDQLNEHYQKFLKLIVTDLGVFGNSEIASLGINVDYEISFRTDSARAEFASRFLSNVFPKGVSSGINHIKFSVSEDLVTKKMVGFEIIAKSPDSFILLVNDHYEKSPNKSFLKPEELLSYFEIAETKLKDKFLKYYSHEYHN